AAPPRSGTVVPRCETPFSPLGYGVIGNTAVSGTAILGSSPGTPAVKNPRSDRGFCCFRERAVRHDEATDRGEDSHMTHRTPRLPISREHLGGRMVYRDGRRRITSSREIARIDALAIPPAWTDVRIA